MYPKNSYRVSAARVSAALALLAAPFDVLGDVILADSFGGRDGARLSGAAVSVWDGAAHAAAPTWIAGANIVVKGGRVTTDADGPSELRLATPNQIQGVLSLGAEVRLGDSGTEWIGLSFLSSTTANFFNPDNTLLLIVNKGGFVMLFKNGAAEKLSTAQIAGFSPAKTYALELLYDRAAGVAHVLVDGVRMNARPIAVGALTSDAFAAVGLRIHGSSVKAGAPAIGNMSYALR